MNYMRLLRHKIETLTAQIAALEGECAYLLAKFDVEQAAHTAYRERIAALEAELACVKRSRDYYRTMNDLNLAENRDLRDQLRGNPYNDDFYNES